MEGGRILTAERAVRRLLIEQMGLSYKDAASACDWVAKLLREQMEGRPYEPC